MAQYHGEINDKKLKAKIKRKTKSSKDKSWKYSQEQILLKLKQKGFNVTLDVFQSKYWAVLHFISITVFCIVLASPLILVPQHDAIKNPKYFYEVIIAVQFSYTLATTMYRMMQCKILFNVDCFMSIRAFLMIYGLFVLSIILLSLLSFSIFAFILVN